MTEVEYVIANFAKRFAAFRDKRIVLHGSRNYAKAIIENFADSFHFIGIMSLEPFDDEFFHGLRVLKEEDIPTLDLDLIILTERVKYAVEAFHAARRMCRKYHIALYNMYGLDEFLLHYEAETASHLTLEEAEKLCSSYDIVAFEVMDTVLYSSIINENITARVFFCDLIRYLREQRKEIKFSLRKSFSAEIQIKTLVKYALVLDKRQELIQREGEDLSFRKLKENNPGKKILYFGSGLPNEFILPRCYGIDTCRFVDSRSFDSMVPGKRTMQLEYSFLPDLKKSIKKRILEKELISFDIFDTLLLRKTLYPQDVFFITEQKALLSGYDIEGYANARIKAEGNFPFGNISQIYAWLGDCLGWNEELTFKMQALELETEREVLSPRTEVVELLRFAQEAGKRVVLTSDMYISEKDLSRILSEKGITGYEKLLISCDVKKGKHTGLYAELLRFCSDAGKILHIGDNPDSDGTDCGEFGIESIVVPSVLEMVASRGWADSIHVASELMEHCLLGLLLSKIFRDPFQNPNLTDLPVEKQIERFAISAVATLVVGHMTWLIQKLRENTFDGILFFARDGWLSYNIYQKLSEHIALPKAVYFYANRQATFLCCADFPQETEHVIEIVKMTGLGIPKIMENIYQVPTEEILPYKEQESISDYIEKHMDRIQNNADKAKEGYNQYFRNCGMVEGGTYAVVDGFASGHTQKYLSQFLPFHMKGFYFGRNSATPFNKETEYYLQGKNSLLLQRFIELETYITSPEPSQNGMSVNGTPTFQRERRSEMELQQVTAVLKLVESFALEFFTHFYREWKSISPRFIETVYASENYYEAPFILYDDWGGTAIKKRENEEKEE